jgi:hypothetical protein
MIFNGHSNHSNLNACNSKSVGDFAIRRMSTAIHWAGKRPLLRRTIAEKDYCQDTTDESEQPQEWLNLADTPATLE